MARLEFALVVVVTGVLVAFALQRLPALQASADAVRAETRAAQERSVSALQHARCDATAAAPRALPPASAAPNSLISCP